MEEAPHLGRVSLSWDSVRGQWLLYDTTLGLTIGLDPCHQWELRFTEGGVGYLLRDSGDERQTAISVSDFFDYALVQDRGQPGQMKVLARDGSQTPLQDFKQSHDSLEVPLRQAALACTSLCVVYRLKRAWGAWCFWSLKALRNNFCPASDTTPSSWYQNWWQWWEKHLLRLDIPPREHLRRPVRTQHAPKRQFTEVDDNGIDVRVFEEASASSYAMVALLVKWCSRSVTSKPKTESLRCAWQRCAQSLVDTFLVLEEPLVWPIVLSETAVATPGLPLSGGKMVDLGIVRGQVQLSSLLGEGSSIMSRLLELMNCFEMNMHLVEFLQRLSAVGVKGHWLLKQMVWHLAAALEGALLPNVPTEKVVLAEQATDTKKDPAADCAGQSRRAHARDRRRLKLRIKMKVKPARVLGSALRIAKYFFAGRKCFEKPHHMSIAVDAGRVGKIEYMCGVAGLPSGDVVWLPPQAPTNS